jgi:hypothetical protein
LSFQPFAVQCVTCGSRLRVNDPAIVGTIATCPKCNSMVQIDAPAGQVAVGQSNVDSQAITEEAIGADGPSADAAPESQADGESPARSFAASDQFDGAAPTAMAAWQSERTQRSRQIALVIAVSLSGLLAAIAVFAWFVNSWRGRAGSGAEVVASIDSELDQPTDDPPEPPAVPPTIADSPDDVARESADPAAVESSSLGEPSETSAVQPADSEPSPTKAVVGTANPKPVASSDPPVPADLLPRSPLADAVDPLAPAAAEPGGMMELPPGLQKYLDVLPDAGVTEPPTLRAPPTMDEIDVKAAAVEGDDPLLGKPRTLNLKADLAIPLALAAEGYPLADLVLLIGQITGVPIQLDWVSLDLAGLDINAPVPINNGPQSARQLLDAAAAAIGAEIREEETLLVLTTSDTTFERAIGPVIDLQDFADPKQAAQVLNQFLDDKATGRGLQIGTSREQQQLAGLAVESLRRMRGMDAKVADDRLRRWARPAEPDSVDWPLVSGGDAGPQRFTPITIAGFLRRMAKRNQSSCVVNWYDASRRAAPEVLVLPHAGATAAITLQRTLAPFKLQVRAVDDQHWWVGTEATYDRLTAVVWTAPLGDSRDRFTQNIHAIMKGATRDTFRFTVDDQSDRALMLLPRYIVRQLPKIEPAMASN